jgi:hypothetical protein
MFIQLIQYVGCYHNDKERIGLILLPGLTMGSSKDFIQEVLEEHNAILEL